MATSTEDLQGLIRQARDAAAELLSEDSALGQIAFREILGHLLSERQSAATNGDAAPAVSLAAATSDIDDTFATEEQRAWAVAQFFQIGIDEVRDLFDLGDAEPFLQVGNKQLNKQKSAATQRPVSSLISPLHDEAHVAHDLIHDGQSASLAGSSGDGHPLGAYSRGKR